MTQGFTNDITIPVLVTQGGTALISTTINELLYSSAANTIAGLPTANSGVLVTNSSGVPSIAVGQIPGTATNDSGNAGSIGEFVTSNIAFASATSLTSNIAKDVTSISLTAGDWLVYGNVFFNQSVGASQAYGWISTTSATLPDNSLISGTGTTTAIIVNLGVTVPMVRISLSGTTTVYLSGLSTFVSGTSTACGTISARRVR
jgi:hypothetical protein